MMKRGTPIIVCGLGFGDEGKGTIVDALVRRLGPSAVIRYNGGPQASHNVVAPDGAWHCFAQFGAGSLVAGSRSVLSRHMLIDLESMAVEAGVLEKKIRSEAWPLQTVDPDCLLVTPMQKFVGRMREIARGAGARGSCGMGVGETILDDENGLSLRVRHILGGAAGRRKLREIAEVKLAEAAELAAAAPSTEIAAIQSRLRDRSDPEALFYSYRFKLDRLKIEDAVGVLRRDLSANTLIFEGAQGAMLDRRRGFVPHVTKSDTTRQNALDLLKEARFVGWPFTLGILRAYGHRHGVGPFVSEDASVRGRFADRRNPENRWQGPFRLGWLDLPALRCGIRMNGGVDALAVTGLDRLSGLARIRVCSAYVTPDGRRLTNLPDDAAAAERTALVSDCRPEWTERPGWNEDLAGVRRWRDLPAGAKAFIRFLESSEGLAAPVGIVSVGPTSDHKIFR